MTSHFWRVTEPGTVIVGVLVAIITVLLGIIAWFLGAIYTDLQATKEQFRQLSIQDTKFENTADDLGSETENLKRALNYWAADEFGSMCELLKGRYHSNTKTCKKAGEEDMKYTPPFPDVAP